MWRNRESIATCIFLQNELKISLEQGNYHSPKMIKNAKMYNKITFEHNLETDYIMRVESWENMQKETEKSTAYQSHLVVVMFFACPAEHVRRF